ncbi:MAG: peptidoglycan recognition protein family protein [Pseudoclavibacter sp.]
MTFSKLTTSTSGNGNQFNARSQAVDHFVVHHAADSSLANVLAMMSSGSREVSANYVVKDAQIVGVVPEEYRAWSLGSDEWDGRSITVETCNSATGDASGWPISEASYQSLARLIADCATRYGFPINRNTVIGHKEVYTRHGASYATACPGGINLDRLVNLAIGIQQNNNGGFLMALTDAEQNKLKADVAAIKKITGFRLLKNEQTGAIYAVNPIAGGYWHIPSPAALSSLNILGIIPGQDAIETVHKDNLAWMFSVYRELGTAE